MSVIYKGEVLDTELSKRANGGTEQMRSRLLSCVDQNLLSQVAIHFSRPKELYNDVPNVLHCHDLSEDPAVASLQTNASEYDQFVFVSYWQRDQFINRFNLPYSKCIVIPNAIEIEYDPDLKKPTDQIRFIYHTTPHRGLELVHPIFDRLCHLHENIHLDVFSSFSIYGWEQRDKPYQDLFSKIDQHSHMTYHGAKSNNEVLEALKNAHVFLYPSIWKETSCIALIEAMSSGCLCIYPSYGALPETGSFVSNITMYEYSEKINENANRALQLSHWAIESEKTSPGFISYITSAATSRVSPHCIETYKNSWESLLNSIIERRK